MAPFPRSTQANDGTLEIDPERPIFKISASETKDFRRRKSPKTGFPDRSLGPICDNKHVLGLIVHDTMTFTTEGVPLGLLDLQCWARSGIGSSEERYGKPIEEKESFKWIQSYRAVSQVQNRCRKTMLVVMGDREADIHEIFAEQAAMPHGAQLLIRAERSRNRQVLDDEDGQEPLWPLLEQQPVIGERELLVPPSENRKARKAVLAVRTAPVVLKPPKRKPNLAKVPVWAVLAQEMNAPEGVEPLEWMLLTTVEVQHKEDAFQRLSWYARRWGIEVYHRILKSGCCVEARQLENSRRLSNCLALPYTRKYGLDMEFHFVQTERHETTEPDQARTVES